MTLLIDRLTTRAAKMRQSLLLEWRGDLTVLASFDADFEDLLERIEEKQIRYAHAPSMLNAIYDALRLPPGGEAVPNLSTPGARPVPGHGQFYRWLPQGSWVAIDYAESAEYRDAQPSRAIWLTYTRGARQQS